MIVLESVFSFVNFRLLFSCVLNVEIESKEYDVYVQDTKIGCGPG